VTLVEFLRACLNEDEARAKGLGAIVINVQGQVLPNFTGYSAQRVLVEVDVKRRILEAHAEHPDPHVAGFCRTCGKTDGPCETKRLMALPYADRPGYKDEWRP
jgi:hypothetical protein